MAQEVGALHAPAQVNGAVTPSPAEEEELYDRLLKLRDNVIAGRHGTFKLSDSAIAELKASMKAHSAVDGTLLSHSSGTFNGTSLTTNQAQLQQRQSFPSFTGLPGLQAAQSQDGQSQASTAKSTSAPMLNPIFLEKADSLVRAEGQLKRQRLDRDLQTQVDQRKHATKDKDITDAPSPIDVDLVLLSALERVHHISGLKKPDQADRAASSSFDENDYYSSQVESAWSSEAGSEKTPDKATSAFTADFERLDGESIAPKHHKKRPSKGKAAPVSSQSWLPPAPVEPEEEDDEYEPGEVLEIDDQDEDDDYTPPDASAFDSSRDFRPRKYVPNTNPPEDSPPEDDNSDYEPGEVTDSQMRTPAKPAQQPAQRSPNVQIVRNHLTHLAAPQPNRVSPLATAKGPSIELELVNGRPEVVQKPMPRSNHPQSRATTASPSGNGISGSAKKRRSKKRKRDQEAAGRSKRRRDRQNTLTVQNQQEPFIKAEPVSPPPFSNVSEMSQYPPPHVQPRPSHLDLSASKHASTYQYTPESSRSGLRYEHTQSATPTIAKPPSPAFRPTYRDNQDLRRVASLHHAQQPISPRNYSPAPPSRTVSMTYGNERNQQPSRVAGNTAPSYVDHTAPGLHYFRDERSRSPPRVQEYRPHHAERAPSPALMPPPTGAPRPYIVDQYGNKYYAAEPPQQSASMPPPRPSAAPVDRRAQPEMMYGQAPSRSTAPYAYYESADNGMAPPPLSRRQVAPEPRPDYIDSNGYSALSYTPRQAEPPRYAAAPTSPLYQHTQTYDDMPPPSAPSTAREATSPVYASRSYSVRPDGPAQQATNYMRHASVAPPQYLRQDAPSTTMRSTSVMPGLEYGSLAQQHSQPQGTYTQTPQNVRYVDQHGREVFPREIRQVNEFRYQ